MQRGISLSLVGFFMDPVHIVCYVGVHPWQLGPSTGNAPTHNPDQDSFAILKKIKMFFFLKFNKNCLNKYQDYGVGLFPQQLEWYKSELLGTGTLARHAGL